MSFDILYYVLPKGFLFGAAASAHQVEGGNINDWSEWEQSPQRIEQLKKQGKDPQNYISGRACDHYRLYEQDFDLAKSLGHNSHRFSIEWSRIEPKESKFNFKEIEHYRQVLSALRQRDLEPFLTLWHWPLPIWLARRGGWLNKETPTYFDRFVKIVAENLFKEARFWITLNEPIVYASNSYLKGVWPPQAKNPLKFFKVIANLIRAHKLAYRSLHLIDANCQAGISKHNIYFKGFPLIKYFWNHYFLDKIKNEQDFIGLNYYFQKFLIKPRLPVSDINWPIYPKGIYFLLKDLVKYKKPIYITENGVADAEDNKRADFIKEHLKWVAQAVKEGVDARGYFYWSLLDNFEWDKGFWPRFGLAGMDYRTMERRLRPSAEEYKKIIKLSR